MLGGAAAAEEAKPWYQRIDLTAFVDLYYAWNFNRPANGDSFGPQSGTTAKRANEFALNVGALGVGLAPDPVGFQLTLGYGTGTEVVHSGEPSGSFIGRDVWRFVQQASLAVKRGALLIEAGILPSHIGYETLYSKDNWNYTRSWQAESSPYYQAGVKIAYALTPTLSVQLWIVNGWQVISDNNEGKTLGTQLAWTTEKASITWNTLAGPELAGDSDHWRLFSDLVVILQPLPWLGLAGSIDVGHEARPKGAEAWWYALSGYLRFGPVRAVAFALRGEFYHDRDGAITGIAQKLASLTGTIEWRPWKPLIVKLEGRYDRSSALYFTEHDQRAQDQGLIVLGVVATY